MRHLAISGNGVKREAGVDVAKKMAYETCQYGALNNQANSAKAVLAAATYRASVSA
jgi:hypothetical protein